MRNVLSAVLLLTAISLTAQTRVRPAAPPAVAEADKTPSQGVSASGANVSGKVETVSGTLVTIASSLITIDVSAAKISDGGATVPATAIKPGDVVFATLKTDDVLPNAPLPASSLVITHPADVTLAGNVQTIDPAAKTFTLLGRTIYTDANTSFGGQKEPVPAGSTFADLTSDSNVNVLARIVSGKIVATSVMIQGPIQKTTLIRGTVKNIAADKWVITTGASSDVTVLVNSQTKIAGSPKVGDKVDVVATTDSANNYIALSIMTTAVPNPVMLVRGTVKSIAADKWVISTEGADVTVLVNAQTKIAGAPKVGDKVDVMVTVDAANNVVAVSIMAAAMQKTVLIRGTVKSAGADKWVITATSESKTADVTVLVTAQTKIAGAPAVGDKVDVVATVDGANNYVALSIVKAV